MSFLFDTNVLSELVRPHPQTSVLTFVSGISQITISAITVEEVIYGLSAKPNLRIQAWVERFFVDYCIILPIVLFCP